MYSGVLALHSRGTNVGENNLNKVKQKNIYETKKNVVSISARGFRLSPPVFVRPTWKGEREKQLLGQKNISDQAKVPPTAFSNIQI